MSLTHVRAFTEAMTRKDLESMLLHVSEDVVLRTPLVADPIQGKPAIRPVVSALLGVVDRFDFSEIMQGSRKSAGGVPGSSPRRHGPPPAHRVESGATILRRTGVGTARPRRANDPRSTRRFVSSKGSWSTRKRKAPRLP